VDGTEPCHDRIGVEALYEGGDKRTSWTVDHREILVDRKNALF